MINVSSIFSGFSANATSRLQNYDSKQRTAPIELKAKDLKPLKEEIAGYDLKNISQQELGALGRKLFDHGLINDTVFAVMGLGNPEYDEQGNQINVDKKSNALEFFNMQLSITSGPDFAEFDTGPGSGKDGYAQVNQVLSVLKLFAATDGTELALSTKA